MALLNLSTVYKRYPTVLKYGIYDVISVIDNEVREKKILTDVDRRILRLHNIIQDNDKKTEKRMNEFAQKYKTVKEVPTDVMNQAELKEWATWALYTELVEALEDASYLNNAHKLTKKDVDSYIGYIAGESAKPATRKCSKSQPRKAKSAFRSGNSQGRGVIRNMNKITGTALNRFK